MNVEYSSNSKKYYFDVTIEEYSDNGVVYVGLYGNDDVLLDLKSSALIDGDITLGKEFVKAYNLIQKNRYYKLIVILL